RSFSRGKVADRSPLYSRCREIATHALGLGRSDIQRNRSVGEPHPSILDVAFAWNPRSQGARYRRLLDVAICSTRSARFVSRLDSELHVLRSVGVSRSRHEFQRASSYGPIPTFLTSSTNRRSPRIESRRGSTWRYTSMSERSR